MTQLLSMEDTINAAWESKDDTPEIRDAVKNTLDLLDQGEIRVSEKKGDDWIVNEWVKKAVLLYFKFHPNQEMEAGEVKWFDKVPLKSDWEKAGVRSVPLAVARYGSFIEKDAVLMPSYVNIGARVGSGTMVDTWATVGSCAQVGRNCHISGGVGIGGVLEPIQANPVIIEDNVFIGARSEVAEGVIIGDGAVLAMGCYIGKSTKVYDAMSKKQIDPGKIPARSVCVPGALLSKDGTHTTYAIIIKKYRDEKTDARTALNSILRESES